MIGVPSIPSALNIPVSIHGGVYNNISWGESTDVQGRAITYELECAYNNGDFTQIYRGNSCVYNHMVDYGAESIQYRVRASNGHKYSDYITSEVVSIYNTLPPVISGEDGYLGEKTDGFSFQYVVTDEDSDVIDVTEAIDGEGMYSYVAMSGETNTSSVMGDTWLKLANGTHTLTITATDSVGVSTVRSYSFTKNVTSLSVETHPMESANMPTRISVTITKNVPNGAIFKVMVCNNGYDDEPTWEDATDDINNFLVYDFTNKRKTADNWGVIVKVTVDRNGAEGACYISAIGGNFE